MKKELIQIKKIFQTNLIKINSNEDDILTNLNEYKLFEK